MRGNSSLRLALLCVLAVSSGLCAQSVPGCTVSTYADVIDPVLLSFAPDGTLYTGTDPVAAGSSTSQKISRIGPGGAPVTSFGVVGTPDPDVVLPDITGAFSGVPGTVLVSGLIGTGVGRISGIHPDGSVVTLHDNGTWANVVEMKIDHAGRWLFTALESRSIWVSTGGAPTILATLPGSAYPTYLTITADNRIVVGASDNKLRIYNSDGSLANGSLASFGGIAGVEVGPGGPFGTDIHVIDSAAGTLVRVDGAGTKTTIGTGFATGVATKDLAFGPSGNLYVSVNTTDKVLLISSPWSKLGFALAGTAGLPTLTGTGALLGGDPVLLDLASARPLSSAALFVGLAQINAPFKGGTLVPLLTVVITGLPTSAAGTLSLATTWPAGLPSGLSLWFQEWIADPAASVGFAATNGLRAITP